MERRPYPSDIDEDTYPFMVPYLVLKPEHAPQRKYLLKDVLNALFWMARTGAQWEFLPHDFPLPRVVQEQAQRWFEAGVFEVMVHDLRILSRVQKRRSGDSSAIIIDSRTLQSTPESGHRAAYDGTKKCKVTKVHLAVDTLGYLSAVLTSPANVQDQAQVFDLCFKVQEATGVKVEVAFADQGYTGQETAQQAAAAGVELVVVKRPEATRGFILLSKRWVMERSPGYRDSGDLAEISNNSPPRSLASISLPPAFCWQRN